MKLIPLDYTKNDNLKVKIESRNPRFKIIGVISFNSNYFYISYISRNFNYQRDWKRLSEVLIENDLKISNRVIKRLKKNSLL